eukprot:CAMPEP_0175167448 /NCGR_PEP_ID=MMETSP0087-20121206/28358_1 /TAXON_ID=136419 /ORGANISM="Unknown Unknown, Strain D1" /LENGTH=141 /DNA_ID=CAMNT_0016457359 /DNA_START=173 /DNA_END=598 /DNA_ORIENTATION=+
MPRPLCADKAEFECEEGHTRPRSKQPRYHLAKTAGQVLGDVETQDSEEQHEGDCPIVVVKISSVPENSQNDGVGVREMVLSARVYVHLHEVEGRFAPERSDVTCPVRQRDVGFPALLDFGSCGPQIYFFHRQAGWQLGVDE